MELTSRTRCMGQAGGDSPLARSDLGSGEVTLSLFFFLFYFICLFYFILFYYLHFVICHHNIKSDDALVRWTGPEQFEAQMKAIKLKQKRSSA